MTLEPRLGPILRQRFADIAKGTGAALDPNRLENVTDHRRRASRGLACMVHPLVVTAPRRAPPRNGQRVPEDIMPATTRVVALMPKKPTRFK